MTEISIGEKENEQAICGCFVFVTQYNSSLSSFVPNFRALSQVVAEKYLTEKSLKTNRQTDRQTNIITEKAKTIYPLYTSYQGYKYYVTVTLGWHDSTTVDVVFTFFFCVYSFNSVCI